MYLGNAAAHAHLGPTAALLAVYAEGADLLRELGRASRWYAFNRMSGSIVPV